MNSSEPRHLRIVTDGQIVDVTIDRRYGSAVIEARLKNDDRSVFAIGMRREHLEILTAFLNGQEVLEA